MRQSCCVAWFCHKGALKIDSNLFQFAHQCVPLPDSVLVCKAHDKAIKQRQVLTTQSWCQCRNYKSLRCTGAGTRHKSGKHPFYKWKSPKYSNQIGNHFCCCVSVSKHQHETQNTQMFCLDSGIIFPQKTSSQMDLVSWSSDKIQLGFFCSKPCWHGLLAVVLEWFWKPTCTT